MNRNGFKQLLYVFTSSTVATALIVMSLLTMKDTACSTVIESVDTGAAFSGVCVSDGNGFALMALGVFIVTTIFVALNVWAVKRLKL